jgi:TM2 domain-containing membrane protein YozV
MTASGRNNEIRTSSAAKKAISAHRAFIYGASIPGWGEIYAGSRVQGILKAALVVFFGTWFTRVLVDIVGGVVGGVFDSLNTMTPFVMPDVPIMSMGISFFGIYYIWLWAMISSVDAAVEYRRKNSDPPQTSIAWAFAMSWVCPGSGQIYTGSRRFGYILFAIYLLGILLIVPVYVDLAKSISELAKSGKLSTNNPYGLINIVHGLMVKVDFSYGKLFQACVRYVAVAGAICALRQGLLESDTRWSKPSIAYGLALIGLGWFCPGVGQLLQKRNRIGYYVLAGYMGSKLIIGFLLGNDLITTQSAETLDWISVLIQWGAMIEAPFQMMKSGRPKRLSP